MEGERRVGGCKCGLYKEKKPADSNHLDLCQSTTMYLYLLILLQLLSSTGASESGIVGGKIAKPHSRPYMVSLQHRGHHVCGGMLIWEDFVLTSAHCLRNAYPLMVVLGAHDLKKWKKSFQKIQVSHYHRHPLHENATQISYDIMLLKLKTTARLTENVTVIGLPKEDERIPASPKCSVAGWGKTNSNNKQGSDVLMEVAVTLEDNSECKSVWQKYFDKKQMMCTRTTGGKGFCQGDSGGPLICNNKAQGIVAFNYAERCDDSQYPHVFMKIPFFMPWIKEVLHGYGANMSLNKQE
ncbi:granzyme B-like isoform X3 [Salmo trutta]|nr:granzyme B-like isoform X3 [Salmo trutta]